MNELEFFEATHTYFFKGRETISVTKCFEVLGFTDFSRVPFEILEPARIKGDLVHQIAQLYGQGILNEDSVDPALLGYFEAIKKFFKDEVNKIIAIEEQVCDPFFGYAGTLDILYLNKKRVMTLDDWKTPLKPHPTGRCQTAAYANAVQKIRKIKIGERAGVMLRDDGTYFRDVHTNSLKRDFDDFVTMQRAAILKLSMKIK